ncbi:MAG: hypothetical protein ACKOC5_06180, partial [Chloroflexota bacterium]
LGAPAALPAAIEAASPATTVPGPRSGANTGVAAPAAAAAAPAQPDPQALLSASPHASLTAGATRAPGCAACHRLDAAGQALPEPARLDPQTGQYAAPAEPGELCQACHDQQNANRSGSHAGLGCTQCHDPHSVQTGCANSQCHANVAEDLRVQRQFAVVPGHNQAPQSMCQGSGCHASATQAARQGRLQHIGVQHAPLSCIACHAAGSMPAAPDPANGRWTTWQSLAPDGHGAGEAHFSHAVTTRVNCARCHSPGNPWSLPVSVNGAAPTPAPPTAAPDSAARSTPAPAAP